jgi:site-specific DNA-methyltransferase (adenine-specific)
MKQEIWLGDCLELMKNIQDNSVDMVLCDLPYGTTSCLWDVVIPFDKLWEQYNRVTKTNGAFLLFSSQPFTTDLICSNRKNFKYPLVWNKNVPTGMSSAKYRPMKYHEDILVFYKEQPTYNPIMKDRVGVGKACYNYDHYCGDSNHVNLKRIKKKYDPDFVQPSSVLDFKVVPNRNGKLHPTQKPVELLEYLIKTYSNEGDLILDNCAGSGSTLLAAKNLNRQFIGIEKEKEYYDIILERLK